MSDESRLVVELDTDGEPVSILSLLRGMHGLKRSVPQAEGVAMDDRGVLYLVSEPNLFYVFSKDEPAQPPTRPTGRQSVPWPAQNCQFTPSE